MVMDDIYKRHHVFGQLSKYAEFYKDLFFSTSGFVSLGAKSVLNIDTYVYTSIQGTLESINQILMRGRINDSYALLRKYYDVVIINVYSDLYLDDHVSLENFVIERIEGWLQGKERLPKYGEVSKYIRSSSKLARINDLLHKDKTYKELRDRCNDHMHYNFYHNLLLNNNEIYLDRRVAIVDQFSKDLENVFILHLSYLFYLNDHYMTSSDYIDSLEGGLTPEEGSQYFVAPLFKKSSIR